MPEIESVEQAVEARLEGGLLYQLTDYDRAYMAGLFDGEGCIGVEREVRHDRAGKVRFRVVATVSNTDLSVVEIMRAMTGHGFVAEVKRNIERNPDAANWKPLFTWRTKGGSAIHIIETMLPYLRIKKPQAELVLREGACEFSWNAVKKLNHRGTSALEEGPS